MTNSLTLHARCGGPCARPARSADHIRSEAQARERENGASRSEAAYNPKTHGTRARPARASRSGRRKLRARLRRPQARRIGNHFRPGPRRGILTFTSQR
jgi:hypothetical protein